jgi:LysM repeat protein
MATVMNAEREQLDFEILPEFVRETKSRTRESLEFASSRLQPEKEPSPYFFDKIQQEEADSPKSDVLETLWPGVHQEFTHTARKPSTPYLAIGFVAGVVVSFMTIWVVSTVSPWIAKLGTHSTAVITQQGKDLAASQNSKSLGGEVITPITSSYEVQSGDTLAAIALHNYKRVSPRLLEEICKANNLKNAYVLNLGQKLALPEYRPLSTQQVAASPGNQAQ